MGSLDVSEHLPQKQLCSLPFHQWRQGMLGSGLLQDKVWGGWVCVGGRSKCWVQTSIVVYAWLSFWSLVKGGLLFQVERLTHETGHRFTWLGALSVFRFAHQTYVASTGSSLKIITLGGLWILEWRDSCIRSRGGVTACCCWCWTSGWVLTAATSVCILLRTESFFCVVQTNIQALCLSSWMCRG